MRSIVYGMTNDGLVVGGDTAPITNEDHLKEAFDYLDRNNCVVGFVTNHGSCGLENRSTTYWHGDETRKDELFDALGWD